MPRIRRCSECLQKRPDGGQCILCAMHEAGPNMEPSPYDAQYPSALFTAYKSPSLCAEPLAVSVMHQAGPSGNDRGSIGCSFRVMCYNLLADELVGPLHAPLPVPSSPLHTVWHP